MVFEVVFCCSANVCRSPACSTLLEAMLSETLTAAVGIGDGGLDPVRDARPCSRMRTWVAEQGVERAVVRDRAPRRLSGPAARADLVVAVDSSVRAELLRRFLGQEDGFRRRLFTLVEVSALASAVTAAVASSSAPGRVETEVETEPLPRRLPARLSWLVSEMDAARGLVELPHTRRWNGARRPVDVPDAHGAERPARHQAMLPVLGSAVVDLAAALNSLTEDDAGRRRASTPAWSEVRR